MNKRTGYRASNWRIETKASSIHLVEVSKLYPGTTRPAIDRVTLEVEPGELMVLLGPSGSGKTTLLKLVNRLLEPSSGRILMDGQPVDSVPAPQLRRRIGYVIQQVGLFPHMRVEENVAVVPRLLDWERARISKRVDELLEMVGLPPAEYRRRYPTQLSGGEQQRVGLARALAASPTTLLMDEPFGALDAVTRARMQQELREIHSRLGPTVLFVTHDVEEALSLAGRIAVLNQGRIVQSGSPAAIVLEPADPFVADLVGSGNILRRLSLMSLAPALRPLESADERLEGPRIALSENLRAALSLLLENRQPRLLVVDAGGHPVGTIDLKSIHASIAGAPLARGVTAREGRG